MGCQIMRTATQIILGISNDREVLMKKGIVKWFNDNKGYGFIQSENKDYFVHFKEIKKNGFKTLTAGEHVTFEVTDSPRGKLAKEVRSESQSNLA